MYLYGASGHAKVIVDILEQLDLPIEGIMDDNKTMENFMGIPFIHDKKDVSPIIISIGNNERRKDVAERLAKANNVEFDTIVHPSAILSKRAKLGVGTVVMPTSVIQTGCVVGKHCIINTGAILEHECVVGDYAHISPNASLCGNVTVGEGTWIGAGATIIQGVKIGKWCIIGAGSVVTKDIPDGYVAYGVPCHRVRHINQHLLGECDR